MVPTILGPYLNGWGPGAVALAKHDISRLTHAADMLTGRKTELGRRVSFAPQEREMAVVD